MEANELTIGSLIKTNKGEIIKVESISTKRQNRKVGYHNNGDCCHIKYARLAQCEPIPLTEEILKANGFERSMTVSDTEPYDLDEEGYAYYQFGNLGKDNKHIWFWYKENEITLPTNCTDWIYIKYVHELQHALRLCGLNELADNFKITMEE